MIASFDAMKLFVTLFASRSTMRTMRSHDAVYIRLLLYETHTVDTGSVNLKMLSHSPLYAVSR